MKFIIAGYGFVGSAIGDLLSKHHEIVPVDPRLNSNKLEDHIKKADGLIIAVSTPPLKTGKCDDNNIWNILNSSKYSKKYDSLVKLIYPIN